MLEELELENTPKLLPDGAGRSSENLDCIPGAAYEKNYRFKFIYRQK